MTMTTILLVIALVWLLGAVAAYNVVFKNDGYDYPVWYSICWPVMIPLWIIHVIHNAE